MVEIYKYYLKKHWNLFFIQYALTIIRQSIYVCIPIYTTYAITHFFYGHFAIQNLVYYILIGLSSIIILIFIGYIFYILGGKIESYIAHDLRIRISEKLQYVPLSFIDTTHSGTLINIVAYDSADLAEGLTWNTNGIIGFASFLIFTVISMLLVNSILALILLLIIPVTFILYFNHLRKNQTYNDKIREKNSLITSYFSESITGNETVRYLNVEEKLQEEFNTILKKRLKLAYKSDNITSLFTPLLNMVEASILIAVLVVLFSVKNMFLPISILIFIQYLNTSFNTTKEIGNRIFRLQIAKSYADRVNLILKAPMTILDNETLQIQYGNKLNQKKHLYQTMQGEIEFKNVSFSYGKEMILNDFNIKIPAKTTLAIVGATGSGKSTLVNLLCRFYEPTSGNIMIDYKDYTHLPLGYIHENLAYVLQTPVLFNMSILDNIIFFDENISKEQAIKAMKQVNGHEFVMELPNGYDTIITSGGSILSQGQKQLICFARALAKQSKLLILDEASSSVDIQSEYLIHQAIEKVRKDKTCIMIAHRLTTVVNADRIIVLEKGKIIEDGTHISLMALKGKYYKLYASQFNEKQVNQLLSQMR